MFVHIFVLELTETTMELISTHTVMTTDIGVNDNLFGGQLMSWIDLAAAAYASQKCSSRNIVTKKVSELIFIKPAKVNHLLKVYGEVMHVGNTSITINIEARHLDVVTCLEEVMCTTSLVLIKVDENGQPTKIDTVCQLKD
jgi:acyl-CoA thioesterase YciA